VQLPVLVALHLGDVEVKCLSTDCMKNLLDELSSPEQFFATLRGLANLLVRSPVLALAAFTTVEG
jgi:hypothetical protein